MEVSVVGSVFEGALVGSLPVELVAQLLEAQDGLMVGSVLEGALAASLPVEWVSSVLPVSLS